MPVSRTKPVDLDDYLGEDEDDLGTITTKPASTKTAVLDDEDDAPAYGTPDYEDEDEDEVPARSSVVQSGWGAAKKAISSAGKGFTVDFKFDEEIQLVKFLKGDPIAIYKQHWLNEKAGRKSYVCIGSKCPLCREAGHSPDQKIAFTLLNFSTEEPEVQLLSVGPRLAAQFEKLHTDPKTGPLDDETRFWALSKTGKGNKTSYSINPVKARDLAEDWSLVPSEVSAAIKAAKPLDETAIRTDSYEELREVAQDL